MVLDAVLISMLAKHEVVGNFSAQYRISRRQYNRVLDVPGDGNCSTYASCLSACFVHKIGKLNIEFNLSPGTLRRAIGKSIKQTEYWLEYTPISIYEHPYFTSIYYVVVLLLGKEI